MFFSLKIQPLCPISPKARVGSSKNMGSRCPFYCNKWVFTQVLRFHASFNTSPNEKKWLVGSELFKRWPTGCMHPFDTFMCSLQIKPILFRFLLSLWKFQVMQKCTDMILACLWQGRLLPCKAIFQIRRTDNGYCCSFNSIKIDEQLWVNWY